MAPYTISRHLNKTRWLERTYFIEKKRIPPNAGQTAQRPREDKNMEIGGKMKWRRR